MDEIKGEACSVKREEVENGALVLEFGFSRERPLRVRAQEVDGGGHLGSTPAEVVLRKQDSGSS